MENCKKCHESIKSGKYCKECRREKNRLNYEGNIKTWRIKYKTECLDYKGGKCEKCGYSKCLSALEFHHLDPKEKDFNISRNKKRNFEMVKKELDKCILVCSNCHREIHEEMKK